MSGFSQIMSVLQNYRGQHRQRDPAALWKCEICPSLCAPAVRVHQRRFISSGLLDEDASDPLLVMVDGSGLAKFVSESRGVLAGISIEREAAVAAAAQAVLAGVAPPSVRRRRRHRVCGWFREHRSALARSVRDRHEQEARLGCDTVCLQFGTVV